MSASALDRLLWRASKHPHHSTDTRMVETQLVSVRVRDTGGQLPPLVFLCDPPVTVEAYDDLIALLSDSFRVVVIELPGFGFSWAKSKNALAFQQTVEAVEAAILKICDRPAILFGPCICGFVAAELSRREVVSIAGVVLMQTPDFSGMLQWREGMDPKKLLRTPYLGQLIVKAKAKSLTPFWFKYATAKDFDHAELSETTLTALDKGAGYPLASMLQLWGEGPKSEQIKHPALIIWGMQDRSHRSTDPKASLAHCCDAEIIEFKQCGHFTELEDPAGFSHAVKPFIVACLAEV